jgi:hypothetical protein
MPILKDLGVGLRIEHNQNVAVITPIEAGEEVGGAGEQTEQQTEQTEETTDADLDFLGGFKD